ncbi:MAG: nuclear transport factor 2 family protein [Fimbriimonadaceae bacterium]|nr:nuclear transport factor 2 family protein [Fimbriimonadaceae bacterium]
MKTKQIFVAILALFAIQAFAQGEKPGLRKDVEAFFAKFDANIASGNLAGLFSMYSPAYYSVDAQGKRTSWAQWKAGVSQITKVTKNAKSKISVKNVQLQEGEVVAWIQQEFWYASKEGDRWVAKKFTTRWAETLKPTDGSFRLISSQELMTNEPWTFKTNGGG